VAQSGLWKRPITTEIAPEATWWTAEGEHQDFLQKNPYGYTCHYMR
jgi:peptide methionine sulfoxide reductase MsrA